MGNKWLEMPNLWLGSLRLGVVFVSVLTVRYFSRVEITPFLDKGDKNHSYPFIRLLHF